MMDDEMQKLVEQADTTLERIQEMYEEFEDHMDTLTATMQAIVRKASAKNGKEEKHGA